MLRERGVAYDPEELALLGYIFDQAASSLPPTMSTPANRMQIAKNILMHAALGERDPVELELTAFANLIVIAAA